MVIITTMVCKIYFPQSLERGSAESQGVSSSRMSYVRVRSIGSRQGSTENDEEGKGKNMSSYYSSDNEDESSMEGAGGEDEEDFSSDEDDDKGGSSDEESESDGLLLEMEEPDAGGVAGSTPHRRRNKFGGRKRAISGGNFLEFDQTTTSRNDVMKRLGLCVLMLNLTFVTWGVLQVRRVATHISSMISPVPMLTCLFSNLHLILPTMNSHLFSGTNAHKEISSHHWRIFYLFLRSRLHQSFLDSHYVGWAAHLP
jgi:hypothetical protein